MIQQQNEEVIGSIGPTTYKVWRVKGEPSDERETVYALLGETEDHVMVLAV